MVSFASAALLLFLIQSAIAVDVQDRNDLSSAAVDDPRRLTSKPIYGPTEGISPDSNIPANTIEPERTSRFARKSREAAEDESYDEYHEDEEPSEEEKHVVSPNLVEALMRIVHDKEKLEDAKHQKQIELPRTNRGPHYIVIQKNITELERLLRRLNMVEELLLKDLGAEAIVEKGMKREKWEKHTGFWKNLGKEILNQLNLLFSDDGKEALMIFFFVLLLAACLPCIFCVQKTRNYLKAEKREGIERMKRYNGYRMNIV